MFSLLQRGSDELLSQRGAVSNGASMSPQPHHTSDNNNDAKKVSFCKQNITQFLINYYDYYTNQLNNNHN